MNYQKRAVLSQVKSEQLVHNNVTTLEFLDACVGVKGKFENLGFHKRMDYTIKYERTYIKKAQQEFIVVPYSLTGQIQKRSNYF